MFHGQNQCEHKHLFIGIGTDKESCFVPTSSPCTKSGHSLINWIAEVTMDNTEGQDFGDWNKSVNIDYL